MNQSRCFPHILGIIMWPGTRLSTVQHRHPPSNFSWGEQVAVYRLSLRWTVGSSCIDWLCCRWWLLSNVGLLFTLYRLPRIKESCVWTFIDQCFDLQHLWVFAIFGQSFGPEVQPYSSSGSGRSCISYYYWFFDKLQVSAWSPFNF